MDNPNYYGFSLDDVVVNLNYYQRTPASSLTGDATTSLVNMASADAPDIRINKRANSTVAVAVTFPANSGTTTANENIIEDCTPTGTTHVYINATVTLLKRIHISVPNQEISFNCSTIGLAAAGGAVLQSSATGNSTASSFCKTP